MAIDHRGRQLSSIPESEKVDNEIANESEEILHEDSMRNQDFIECVFYSASAETYGDRDLFDLSKESKEVHLHQGGPNAPRRSYDVLYLSLGEQNSADESSEFHYKLAPTDEGFRFFNEDEETKINYDETFTLEETSRSIHLAESIIMSVDETTRHCRSAYSALLGDDDVDENTALKKKLRTTCSKQLATIANASRRLLSCPVTNREDTPPSQKMWKMCKERTFALQYRCKELERAISVTATKTREKIDERRRKGDRNLKPSTVESRQAAAQRLKELIQQKHYLNVSDKRSFNQEGFNRPNEVNEASPECNVLEPTLSLQFSVDWDMIREDLSSHDQNDTTVSAASSEAEADDSSPNQSKSTSSIQKLGEFLDQYMDQQTTPDPPRAPEKTNDCNSSSTPISTLDKLGALLGEYFNQQAIRTVFPIEKKTECKVVIEDPCFHSKVKKATESLSYSSGLTECSSEDSSIDCSAIVQHENNVTEPFGAYQADFDLYYKELEASTRVGAV